MRKWALAIISIGLILGTGLLLLGITNGIHHLLKTIIETQSTSISIATIIVSLLVFIYYKKYPEKHVNHPYAMILGFSCMIEGSSAFYWDISRSLSEPQFATGYLVLGFWVFSFFLILGGLLIIESLRVYLEERRLKHEEEPVQSSKWGNT